MNRRRQDEIDFLMETEQGLTAQLERVQSRLIQLLNTDSGAGVISRPAYLSVVPGSDDER